MLLGVRVIAGTIIGVANTQQSGVNGEPLAGCICSVFLGGTTTLATVYQDSGLTVLSPNPLIGDDSGRIPNFWVADGTYKVRLTDADGVMTNGGFESTMLAIGPSSGGGGGGGGVDPTTIFATGDVIWQPISGVRTGWVRENGRTIGSAVSGATERANADTQALFIFLWTNFSNTKCPVSGGRGATALADFSANKTIQLLDFRGRTPVGLDGMGSTRANVLADALVTSGGGDTADTVAATGGNDDQALTQAELPSGVTLTGNTEAFYTPDVEQAPNLLNNGTDTAITVIRSRTIATKTVSVSLGGSGTAHNNMEPFVLGTFYRKL